MTNAILQVFVCFVVLLALVKPLDWYPARVYYPHAARTGTASVFIPF